MQTAWNWSPFYDVGVYLGGDSKKAGTLGSLNPVWAGTLGTFGWGVMPLWVGRQPPSPACANTPNQAYYTDPTGTQDGINDGTAAALAANSFAMPFSIIYADIEPYNFNNSACHQPVQNYVSAWVNTLHQYHFLAGVYFTYTNYADMQGQSGAGVPDAAWVASLGSNQPYAGDACLQGSSPYGLSSPPDSYLPNARIHQFFQNVSINPNNPAMNPCAVFGQLSSMGGNSTVDWDVEDAPVLPWSSPSRLLPAPLLTSPLDGTVEPGNSDVTVQWNPLNAAIYGYLVMVSTDLGSLPLPNSTTFGCQGTCIVETPSSANSFTIPGCLLQKGVTYYWTVQAYGVYKSASAQIAGSFTIGSSVGK
jgi:hypothetical protein